MKKERFFRLLGDLDDAILDKYRQMDAQLSRKAHQKKRTLRILAVAACLALLIGACVPVGMLVAQLGKNPSTPSPTIRLQSLAELETMREMVDCEDEQVLNDYLHSIVGGGAQSRQDLIDFLSVVDNTPYVQIIDGEITDLIYNEIDKRFSVSAEAESGESVYISYELGMSNVEKSMEKAAKKLGKNNLLSAPLSTQDGRLTLYTETREPSDNGDVIRWQGVLDGIAVYIVYWVPDADTVDTAALLESLEIMESIVPQFPQYAWSNTKFGAFVDRPRYEIYATADAPGNSFGHVDSEWMSEEYSDPNAKQTITVTHQGMEFELEYQHSMPARYTRQAYHVYESERTEAWLDAETGSVMFLNLAIKRDELGEALTQDELVQVVNDFFATLVKDPEAYSTEVNYYESSGGASVKFVRYVGDLPSCDSATISVSSDGQINYYILNYLGAMRNAQPIPDSTRDYVIAVLENMIQGFERGSYELDQYALTLDGCFALDCNVDVRYTDSDGMQWGDGAWMLFALTEPFDGNGNEEITVTTTPVTTEPVTTEPETTQPPRETESQIDWNDVPKFVKFGYLNIAVLDANGDVVYRVDAETLQSMKRSVEVEYVQGGTLILECYAAYNRSGQVRNYRCTAKDGVTEQIDLAEITTELEVDVQAEYVHYLRFSVPIDNMVTDSDRGYSMEMLGDYVYSSIEGRALMEYITVYLTELTDTTEPGSGFESEPESESESELNSEQIPFMVTSGFLSVDFQDEKGTVTSVIREEEIDHFYGIVWLDELPNGQFIVECYAIFNPSGDVNFIAIPKGVTFEMLEPANVADRLSWSGETDGLYGFRMVIPTEVLESDNQGAMMLFEHPGYEVAQPVISVWFNIKDS